MTVIQYELVIYGEPCSKANSRRLVPRKCKDGRVKLGSIKSQKALNWIDGAAKQIPFRPESDLLTGKLVMFCKIYYASERPDLDESLVLDFLQGRVYKNDRQVRERHVYHFIDRENPRVEVLVRPRD
jgi:Holliday junction resolvase RusA-like endonuclease